MAQFSSRIAAFPLVAAGVAVLVMPIIMGVLMRMTGGLVAVLMAIMSMGRRFVGVFMLMFVFVMAAHDTSLLSYKFFIILTSLAVLGQEFS